MRALFNDPLSLVMWYVEQRQAQATPEERALLDQVDTLEGTEMEALIKLLGDKRLVFPHTESFYNPKGKK